MKSIDHNRLDRVVLDARKGGYEGRVSVGRDGMSAEIGGRLS